MNVMKYKLLYFAFSLVLILPGIYFLMTSGLKLGLDFTGGALLEYRFEDEVSVLDLKKYGQIIPAGENTFIIKSKPLTSEEINSIKKDLENKYGQVEERRVENVGPVIGAELKQKAITALLVASVVIVLYISFSFRKVPRPASPWRFGIVAIVALLHDILMVVGVFAILGKFLQVEIDALFVTALLTIIGFSVHDTIVVFDRIRENLIKNINKNFTEVANISVVQTLGRSLNTSLTVVFVLLALLLFGGETIKWFVVALLVGVISGTYSSIFNATALLVWWEERLGH
ncbi:protein translocase subunit SecF [Candidatus Daviesbacteria bacterium]|nr:protein translocase subunit SecF [Candidatus Daviesbacteria bacterium]